MTSHSSLFTDIHLDSTGPTPTTVQPHSPTPTTVQPHSPTPTTVQPDSTSLAQKKNKTSKRRRKFIQTLPDDPDDGSLLFPVFNEEECDLLIDNTTDDLLTPMLLGGASSETTLIRTHYDDIAQCSTYNGNANNNNISEFSTTDQEQPLFLALSNNNAAVENNGEELLDDPPALYGLSQQTAPFHSLSSSIGSRALCHSSLSVSSFDTSSQTINVCYANVDGVTVDDNTVSISQPHFSEHARSQMLLASSRQIQSKLCTKKKDEYSPIGMSVRVDVSGALSSQASSCISEGAPMMEFPWTFLTQPLGSERVLNVDKSTDTHTNIDSAFNESVPPPNFDYTSAVNKTPMGTQRFSDMMLRDGVGGDGLASDCDIIPKKAEIFGTLQKCSVDSKGEIEKDVLYAMSQTVNSVSHSVDNGHETNRSALDAAEVPSNTPEYILTTAADGNGVPVNIGIDVSSNSNSLRRTVPESGFDTIRREKAQYPPKRCVLLCHLSPYVPLWCPWESISQTPKTIYGWGLPRDVCEVYKETIKGVNVGLDDVRGDAADKAKRRDTNGDIHIDEPTLYPWQRACLFEYFQQLQAREEHALRRDCRGPFCHNVQVRSKVTLPSGSLLYSASTGGGKTLVAEVALIRCCLGVTNSTKDLRDSDGCRFQYHSDCYSTDGTVMCPDCVLMSRSNCRNDDNNGLIINNAISDTQERTEEECGENNNNGSGDDRSDNNYNSISLSSTIDDEEELYDCLSNNNSDIEVSDGGYSFPQSPKKVIFVVPYVALAEEKATAFTKLMAPLQNISEQCKRVCCYAGVKSRSLNDDIFVCTTEKANILINAFLERNRIDEIGMVIVDELQQIRDAVRGHTMELLMTKVISLAVSENPDGNADVKTKIISNSQEIETNKSHSTAQTGSQVCITNSVQSPICVEGTHDQVSRSPFPHLPLMLIGMSATLSNAPAIAEWMSNALLFITDFRPVPLKGYYVINGEVFCDPAKNNQMSNNKCGDGVIRRLDGSLFLPQEVSSNALSYSKGSSDVMPRIEKENNNSLSKFNGIQSQTVKPSHNEYVSVVLPHFQAYRHFGSLQSTSAHKRTYSSHTYQQALLDKDLQHLALEGAFEGFQVLIFCHSRTSCETGAAVIRDAARIVFGPYGRQYMPGKDNLPPFPSSVEGDHINDRIGFENIMKDERKDEKDKGNIEKDDNGDIEGLKLSILQYAVLHQSVVARHDARRRLYEKLKAANAVTSGSNTTDINHHDNYNSSPFFTAAACGRKGAQNNKNEKNDKKATDGGLLLDDTNNIHSHPHHLILYGIAFHHAGLTAEERILIEEAYRLGTIWALCCTTTLSTGVNLPARRVIFRGVLVANERMDSMQYQQAAGRAGRAGLDTTGEAYVIGRPVDRTWITQHMMTSVLPPIESNFSIKKTGMMRVLLEGICTKVLRNVYDIQRCVEGTLLAANRGPIAVEDGKTSGNEVTNASYVHEQPPPMKDEVFEAARQALDFLESYHFIIWDSSLEIFFASALGEATVASSLAPDEALMLYDELSKAKQCLCLENDLHLLYLSTPFFHGIEPNWARYYHDHYDGGGGEYRGEEDRINMINRKGLKGIPTALKDKICGNIIGINAGMLHQWSICPPPHNKGRNCVSGVLPQANGCGYINTTGAASYSSEYMLLLHRRFYATLILWLVINEVPLFAICANFHPLPLAELHRLIDLSSSFSNMVASFCNALNWWQFTPLFEKMSCRLSRGVESDLLPLMRIEGLSARRARELANKGYRTTLSVASATPRELESVLSADRTQFVTSGRAVLFEPYRAAGEGRGDYGLSNNGVGTALERADIACIAYEGKDESKSINSTSFSSHRHRLATLIIEGAKAALAAEAAELAESLAQLTGSSFNGWASYDKNISSGGSGGVPYRLDTPGGEGATGRENRQRASRGKRSQREDTEGNGKSRITRRHKKGHSGESHYEGCSDDNRGDQWDDEKASNRLLEYQKCIEPHKSKVDIPWQSKPHTPLSCKQLHLWAIVDVTDATQWGWFVDTFRLNITSAVAGSQQSYNGSDCVNINSNNVVLVGFSVVPVAPVPSVRTDIISSTGNRQSPKGGTTSSFSNGLLHHHQMKLSYTSSPPHSCCQIIITILLSPSVEDQQRPHHHNHHRSTVVPWLTKSFYLINISTAYLVEKGDFNINSTHRDNEENDKFGDDMITTPARPTISPSNGTTTTDIVRDFLCSEFFPRRIGNESTCPRDNADVHDHLTRHTTSTDTTQCNPSITTAPVPYLISIHNFKDQVHILRKMGLLPSDFGLYPSIFYGNSITTPQTATISVVDPSIADWMLAPEDRTTALSLKILLIQHGVRFPHARCNAGTYSTNQAPQSHTTSSGAEGSCSPTSLPSKRIRSSLLSPLSGIFDPLPLNTNDTSIRKVVYFNGRKCEGDEAHKVNMGINDRHPQISIEEEGFYLCEWGSHAAGASLRSPRSHSHQHFPKSPIRPGRAVQMVTASQKAMFEGAVRQNAQVVILMELLIRKMGCNVTLQQQHHISKENQFFTTASTNKTSSTGNTVISPAPTGQLIDAFFHVEMPVTLTLIHMECAGIGLDRTKYTPLIDKMLLKSRELVEEAYQVSGTSNWELGSIKDCARVLYDVMEMPCLERTFDTKYLPTRLKRSAARADKSGKLKKYGRGGKVLRESRSTKASSLLALERMFPHIPLPSIIMEYRTMDGWMDKYLHPLLKAWTPIAPLVPESCAELKKRKMFGTATGSVVTNAIEPIAPQASSLKPVIGRIYGVFFQTSTATGRLTMGDPNLQTIPHPIQFTIRRTMEVVNVRLREAFVATPLLSVGLYSSFPARGILCGMEDSAATADDDDEWVLLSADYAQIEARILAHFSNDPELIAVFSAEKGSSSMPLQPNLAKGTTDITDIFVLLASKIHNISTALVTLEERKAAKTLCYGMIYGKGVNSIADDLGVSYGDAEELLRSFRETYPVATKFTLHDVPNKASQLGYVETLLGRRRWLQYAGSKVNRQKSASDRIAVNSLCQGSAADIVKVAMVDLLCNCNVKEEKYNIKQYSNCVELPTSKYFFQGSEAPARLLLQIHDELLFEVRRSLLPIVAPYIAKVMSSVGVKFQLRVPLQVRISVGPNWAEMVPYVYM